VHDRALVRGVHRLRPRRAVTAARRAARARVGAPGPRDRPGRAVPEVDAASRRLGAGVLGGELHLRDLPLRRRSARGRRRRRRSRARPRGGVADGAPARGRRLGRASRGRARRALRRAPREPAGDDGVGAARPARGRPAARAGRPPRRRLADRAPACRRRLAGRRGQRGLLRLGHAPLPALSGVFPGVGAGALRRGVTSPP